MDAAGKNIAALASNIAKNIEAKASNDINGQIALAEETGRASTMAAAAGVGGSTVDAFNATVRLRAGMQQEQSDRAFASDLYAANQDKGAILYEAVAGLDNNQYRANLDYRKFVDHKKMGVFQQIATLGVAAAATYFGGPQAGQAVIDVSTGINQAQNGDFAGASASLDGAVSGAFGAVKDTRSMGGKPFFSKAGANVPQLMDTPGAAEQRGQLWGSVVGTRQAMNAGQYLPFTLR